MDTLNDLMTDLLIEEEPRINRSKDEYKPTLIKHPEHQWPYKMILGKDENYASKN